MKKLTYLIVILIIAALSPSCTKKPLCCVLPQPVLITAQKNGVAWQLPVIKSLRSNDSIYVATAGSYYLNTAKDSLTMHFVYNGLGNFKPADSDVSYVVFANGEKIKYILDTDFNNSIDITGYERHINQASINPAPIELKATFNLKFVDPAHTTSVSFSDGKLTAYLAN